MCGSRGMLKPLSIVLLLGLAGTATGQTPPTPPTDAVLQKCLLVTFDDTWTRLHLSTDQLKRMLLVQQACREECEAARVRKVDNPISNAGGSTVLSEVRNILTKEQYDDWVAQCGAAPQGEKPSQ